MKCLPNCHFSDLHCSDPGRLFSLNSAKSKEKVIKCGVPQESILGPLLCLKYNINNIFWVCISNLLVLFAVNTCYLQVRPTYMYRYCKILYILTHWGRDKMAANFLATFWICIFLNESVWIFIKTSLKFVLMGPINVIPTLVQITAWHCQLRWQAFIWTHDGYFIDAYMHHLASVSWQGIILHIHMAQS